VMELAAKVGLLTEELMLTRFDLYNADEVFLTGTAAEIIPVVEMDSRRINGGAVGARTLKLITAFRQLTKKDGVRYAV
jgi:branched-chain amino acid aminotransferase